MNIGKADDDTVTDLRDWRFDLVEGIPGHGVNERKLIDELTARTEAREFGTVEFENEPIEPEVTIATIKETLVMRSSAYTSYAKGHYGRAERVHNMTKACGLLYGTVLQPGDVLQCIIVGCAGTGCRYDLLRLHIKAAGNALRGLVDGGFGGGTGLMAGVRVAGAAALHRTEAFQHGLVHRRVGRIVQIDHRSS